jgi:hypothetical protein
VGYFNADVLNSQFVFLRLLDTFFSHHSYHLLKNLF